VKKYLLLDHDGVLVDTEEWYFRAGQRAVAEIGFTLDRDRYLQDMTRGLTTWAQVREAGVDEATVDRLRAVRNDYYQEYLRTEDIEIEGVVEALTELSRHVRMAVVTTAKRDDFEIIHERRDLLRFMDFVLVREDYEHAKPHPEPYLTALRRFGASPEEALVVEDSARGLRSAVAAGIDCVVVDNAFTRGQDLSQATHRVKTLREVADILDKRPDVRRATAADAPVITELAQEAYAPYVERMGGQRPAPMDLDYHAVVRDAETWVAESDGEVVGFLVLVSEDAGMVLDGVAVRPSHQGRGAGRALLTLAEERARATGHDRISLYTNEAMVENQALYERIGYVETGRATAHGFARVFYEKSLA
jgi:HAD superfamily hydrolase (TIGR01509 family)